MIPWGRVRPAAWPWPAFLITSGFIAMAVGSAWLGMGPFMAAAVLAVRGVQRLSPTSHTLQAWSSRSLRTLSSTARKVSCDDLCRAGG